MKELLDKLSHQNPWISDRIVLLVRSGSHAYGTNTETSDEDFKGVCVCPREYYFGFLNRFEQQELKNPDTVIYEIKKFFNLAAANNPNILEVLFASPEDILYVNDIGQQILNNRDKFLSKRIKHTFTGYAVSQLKRIKLHRRYLLNPPKKKPTREEYGLPNESLIPQDQLMAVSAEIEKELEKYQFDFMEELNEPAKIAIRSHMTDMLARLKISKEDQWICAARAVGLDSNFIEIMQKERAYKNAKTEWDNYIEWQTNRNKKRYELELKYGFDCKFAYHLVRLIRMCREIMTTGKVLVKRPDREELLAIRNGAWTYEQLIEFAENEDKALQEIYNTSTILPKTPDINYLDNLCMQLIERMI